MQRFDSQRPAASRRRVHVYDHRSEGRTSQPKLLDTSGLDINEFRRLLRREFSLNGNESYELFTTDRIIVDFDKFNEIKDGATLYLMQSKHQQLPGATVEPISFTPHYHTLTEAGTYEYHASEGSKALPFALAELIDNALSATSKNIGARTIEIRMMFDGSIGKPALIVMDNGCGMTSTKLKNWAVYKLSKFTRDDGAFSSERERYARPDPVRRSLNSDISYFGVGGKQAIFFIGNSVRMITRPADSPDVHELVLSEEEFKRREANKEEIFSGFIKNRRPGESSQHDERFLQNLIAEERGKESFTAVVITGLRDEHIAVMKNEFGALTRELAHIYHYYIHGSNGNNLKFPDQNNQIDIQVTLREKPPKIPRAINLREVDDDMQTLYINSAADTFEFTASSLHGDANLEGIIRYHPFLYDKETYPQEPSAEQASALDEDDLQNRGRGKKAIFECFWNGRLIPSTTVSEFDWCSRSSKRSDEPPAECYNRLSGVLFTDDGFKVTQNKLTFMDLELKLKEKDVIFRLVSQRQNTARRGDIKREFSQWLLNCHTLYDKQVKFIGLKDTFERDDPKKKMTEHWTAFSAIEWDGRRFRAGERVRSCRTNPSYYGTVADFLLCGKYSGDVFGAGGRVKITREPRALYSEKKEFPISKIDRDATDASITTYINNELLKFPKELKVEWPESDPWPDNAVRSAGSSLGPLKITILNGKGESKNLIPSGSTGGRTTLNVKFSLVHHGHEEKKTEHVAQYSAAHGFWFTKTDMIELGNYTLSLNAIVSENGSTEFNGTELPSHTLKFTITAGAAQTFMVEPLTTPVRVGVPFNIRLKVTDGHGHPAEAPVQPQPELSSSDLALSLTTAVSSGNMITIQGVKAAGKLREESVELHVSLPGLRKDAQSIKINIRPGLPDSVSVTPKEDPIQVENGNEVMFHVEVHDEAGNVTTNPRQTVRCQVQDCRPQTIDCSSAGAGQFSTKPINLKITKGEPQPLQVSFEMPNHKDVSPVKRELLVLPSMRVTSMELYVVLNNVNLEIKPFDKISWIAGGLLENLFYRLLDEAGRDVELTPEVVSKIKVTWTGVNMEEMERGKLPDIPVPKQAQEERACQVFYEHSVSLSFTVVPLPDEPTKLKVTLPQSTVKLGETLPGNICLELVDKYDNPTRSLTQTCSDQMNVEAEGLDKAAVSFAWQDSSRSVAVSGVCFTGGTPGPREMSFSYQSFVELVVVRVTAGVPAKLTLLSTPPQPLQFLSGTGSDTPFVVQLCDEWGNPSDDQTAEVKITSSPPGLKVTTSGNSHHVNAEGKASLMVDSVSGPKGPYQLMFQVSCKDRLISSPSVNLIVIPDSKKPVKLLVEYDRTARLAAGRFFPVFAVTVASEEGSPVTSFEPAALSMRLWRSGPSGNAPPEEPMEMKCSRPLDNDRKDRYYFREKEIPAITGRHVIQFSLRINDNELLSGDEIPVDVVSDQPVKLGPESPILDPVVSSTEDIANRTLVENMTLFIMDSHGNPAGQDLNGKVVVSITCAQSGRNHSLPLFEGSVTRAQFKLVNGKAHIPRLAIMKNSPGENGTSYVLRFKAEVSVSLAPYRLHFLFSSDAQKQRMMSDLTKKKAELTSCLATYNEYLSTFTDLCELLTAQCQKANQTEAEVRDELKKKNIPIRLPVSIVDIDTMISKKTAEAERVQRRTCSIPDPFTGQQDVLGKVGHLAQLQDDDAARVISWNIGGRLDCVVTRTTAAAQKIHGDTRGEQQVWPLDSMSAPPANRPLPHIQRGRPLFDPPGNPVLARELLIYPQHEQSCKMVFQNLLGDTILIDDLDSANQYRRMVVQKKIYCPTILTRQGDRVESKGIFGGAQNKAPPMDRLKVLAAPFPENYHTIEEQKKLLTQYRSALLNKEEAEKELKQHLDTNNKEKQQEMENKQKELEEVDRQLASLQAKPTKRGLPDTPDSSGISAKIAKM
ncbi:structural maintenance of chromosomes flexible hinge domain-containing protein 1 [Salarias fasciatus]|uniref:structural maintenance of chromosomes flexible hinge domain-containing protein 1 n=1 Tax=Salarias fasciatus TaxID=181472 RepID=UPI001176547D|nr:structural maintenance of chromosomes flexible hinge domain-containing protein 1 [Salarias fasciatus]